MKLGTLEGNTIDAIKQAIADKIGEGQIEVSGGGGHYTIEVVSKVFEGKNMLQSQRLVLGAIAHLMQGDGAPVHAVDSLKTRVG